jgi:putative copper resistance protein D
VYAIVEPARLAGAWSGIFDRSLHALLLGSNFGTTSAVRMLGLLIVFSGSLRPGRTGDGVALIGATLISASFTLMGHTATDAERWLLAPLLLAHLVAIAFWFGSLWPLAAVARYEQPAVAGVVIGQFSRVAVRTVPAILIVGILMAGVLLPDWSSLRTPYGFSLLAKVAGFTILMGLAATNKWRLGPRIGHGDRASGAAFRFLVMAEWLLILAVIAVTATMTALFSVG